MVTLVVPGTALPPGEAALVCAWVAAGVLAALCAPDEGTAAAPDPLRTATSSPATLVFPEAVVIYTAAESWGTAVVP